MLERAPTAMPKLKVWLKKHQPLGLEEIATLDLSRSVGWEMVVHWWEHDMIPDDWDWWVRISRPGKLDFGGYRAWGPPGDARNEVVAGQLIRGHLLLNNLLAALNLGSRHDVLRAVINNNMSIVMVKDQLARHVYRR